MKFRETIEKKSHMASASSTQYVTFCNAFTSQFEKKAMSFFEDDHEEFVEWVLLFSELIRQETHIDINDFKKTPECLWAPAFVTYCHLAKEKNLFTDAKKKALEKKEESSSSSSDDESSSSSSSSSSEEESESEEDDHSWECCEQTLGGNDICKSCDTWRCHCERKWARNTSEKSCERCGCKIPK